MSFTSQNIWPQPDHDHLHTILAHFLSRGQTIVEDLPTLSLLLETRCSIQALQLLIWAARTGISSALCHLLLQNLSGAQARGHSYLLSITAIVGLYHFFQGQELSAIICAVEIGRATTVLSLASFIQQTEHYQQRILKSFSFDMILVISFQLGCRDASWIIVGILHYVNTTLDIWHPLSDKRKSVALILSLNLVRLISRCLVCLSLMFVFRYITYPTFELAAGGNWNLRFLSASTRRVLRGHGSKPVIIHGPLPRYALVSYIPQSLYIQGAGFLYTDGWTWDQGMRLYRPLNETESLLDSASRVTLRDSIRYTAPWIFRRIPTYKDTRTHLLHNNLIEVRSGASGRYLAVEMGTISIIDRLGFARSAVDRDNDGTRWTVSTISMSNASSTWALEYAPETSQKFKLWNTAANCYLSTSYRSFPDWDGVYANDTVL